MINIIIINFVGVTRISHENMGARKKGEGCKYRRLPPPLWFLSLPHFTHHTSKTCLFLSSSIPRTANPQPSDLRSRPDRNTTRFTVIMCKIFSVQIR